ncbi:MAG: hypothetical protein BGO69_06025 [Bacteroidetes bacterium 46-16]|nr:MAG: hypothetical protein BGO69_06025 [Bacteroidetes bacterium 46-16]
MALHNQQEKGRNIAPHIFSGSIMMIGVCITVIALFRALKTGTETLADNILGADTLIFILTTLISYASLRSDNNKRLERVADALFFTGMLTMVVVGLMILYSTY